MNKQTLKNLLQTTSLILLLLGIQTCISQPIQKIAFGSCNRQYLEQDIWPKISEKSPDLFVWLGDVVYSDASKITKYLPIYLPNDIDTIADHYQTQKDSSAYTQFLEDIDHRVIGVWDDHDYGKNDGGAEFELKHETQKLFLDFIDEPKTSPRHQRPGLYNSYTYGDNPNSVKIILLDVRFFKTDEDLLGDQQWQWLEEELKTSSAKYNIIGSGIQFLPSDKPLTEKWGSYPGNLERLYSMIKKYEVPGVILISGDVHHAEILQSDCKDIGYPIYEITSSGLTHSVSTQFPSITQPLFPMLMHSELLKYDSFLGKNFGMINIDWENDTLDLELYNDEGILVQHHRLENQLGDHPCLAGTGVFGWTLWSKGDIVKRVGSIVTSIFLLGVGLYYLMRS
eukprot:TRINITY_DN8908_c0_g2_i1.p1 TRINITY_DN8908_c0_g2~~TRINITY_DN8908_c0_g2_i1.p1  ORF type:complete len:396 (-),score=60.06 TRINITY_DN8908_c0_g2_i1:64-1251(-)